jgi:hypothetical protein
MTQATCEPDSAVLTTAEVAQRLNVPLWWLRSLLFREKLAPPPKLGPVFIWRPEDLPRVRAALVAEGYLPNGGE